MIMALKKADSRIRALIENAAVSGHRSMFLLLGNNVHDGIVLLHNVHSKFAVKTRLPVLWCFKHDLKFNTGKKKRLKHQQKVQGCQPSTDGIDSFETFLYSNQIRYCHYSETNNILGNTYKMCILQDFEALTPNLLAKTIETVEGGGLIVVLLPNITSMDELYTMEMDVHHRFRTEAYDRIICRFNKRLVLSLSTNTRCMVLNDQFEALQMSTKHSKISNPPDLESVKINDQELSDLQKELSDTPPAGALIANCKTLDQATCVLRFIDALLERSLTATVSLTAARGRGKSAALGLAISAAISFDYANIFVTSPNPENLSTMFTFLFKGFDALGYREHEHYELVQSTNPEFGKAIVRVNVFKDRRQTVQYIHPNDNSHLSQAELLVIDEAAAIPLPQVKALLGRYPVFLASTISGYEGTGRSLSLKLLDQLRERAVPLGVNANNKANNSDATQADSLVNQTSGRVLHELTLKESIRYRNGDMIEQWLGELLCLDPERVTPIRSGFPAPIRCDLYYVNRDTLFCFHKSSEDFLQRIVALFAASHYKNCPNDLQMLSDAPAHHLFCLMGPIASETDDLPEILVAVQVCMEGQISKTTVSSGMAQGEQAAGDLIPWTVCQQFQDEDFPLLSGARIVRIATHPHYQNMGYGARALLLLQNYFEFQYVNLDEGLDENIPSTSSSKTCLSNLNDTEDNCDSNRQPKELAPLLTKLSDRPPENLDYLGVCFGLTEPLLRFWKRAKFVPVYLRQTVNDLTGEHSCIMLSRLGVNDGDQLQGDNCDNEDWLKCYSLEFRRRLLRLLRSEFHHFSARFAHALLHQSGELGRNNTLTKDVLDIHFTPYALKRLEMYSNNLVDFHLITDLIPKLAKLFFPHRMIGVQLSSLQEEMLVGMGIQKKTVAELATELELPQPQFLGIFNRIIRRIVQHFNGILESNIEITLGTADLEQTNLMPVQQSIHDELEEAANTLKRKQKKALSKLKAENLAQYAIKGSEADWVKALFQSKSKKTIISVKSDEAKASGKHIDASMFDEKPKGKKFKKGHKRKPFKT